MDSGHVRQVRLFNRAVTQRVGALEESYLHRGRPLAEARLIFEIGANGADVRGLRKKLALDSGYLSRLLRSLEAQGLIVVRKRNGDGRLRCVNLTAKGNVELVSYDALSDKLAESMLAPLDAPRRDRLVIAMAEVERLIRSGRVEVALEAAATLDARRCFDEYFRELAERFESGFDPTRDPVDIEQMEPPAGWFVMARLDGIPVGCGALRRCDEMTGEIKRMWTAPSARGLGIASRVLQTLETVARRDGLTKLRLETNRTLAEAQALYRKEGYHEVAAYTAMPYADHFFEKLL